MQESTVSKKRVCIIDDDAYIRDIYRVKFDREGFGTMTAANGVEGLAMIRQEHPDIILLDLQMPVLDGISVIQELRADPTLKTIPVIVLSNVDQDEMFQKVSDLGGACHYLIKSLADPQKVVDVTASVLSERSQGAE